MISKRPVTLEEKNNKKKLLCGVSICIQCTCTTTSFQTKTDNVGQKERTLGSPHGADWKRLFSRFFYCVVLRRVLVVVLLRILFSRGLLSLDGHKGTLWAKSKIRNCILYNANFPNPNCLTPHFQKKCNHASDYLILIALFSYVSECSIF